MSNMPKNLNKDQVRADQRTKSSASGDVWIPCKSKTYSGLSYYFNRSTGEAVWSLDFEKQRDKHQANIDKGAIHFSHNYPEPKVPPNSQYFVKSQSYTEPPSSSHIYNKQIINNRFAKHPWASFGNSVFPSYLTYNALPQQYGFNLPTAGAVPYNPNIWPIPPTPQFFMGSSVPHNPSMIFPTENLNNNDQIFVQSTSLLLSDRFKNIENDSSNEQNPRKVEGPKLDKSQPYIGKSFGFTQRSISPVESAGPSTKLPANDLRLTLVAKRRKSCEVLERPPEVLYGNDYVSEDHPESQLNCEENISREMKNLNILNSQRERNLQIQREQHKFTKVPTVKKRITFEKSDSDSVDTHNNIFDEDSADESTWVVEEFDLRAIPPKKDVSRLMEFAKPDVRKDVWYIVVDTCVLLSNLVFVNIVVKSDEHCRMMVPYRVYSEMKTQSSSVSLCSSQRAFAMAKRARRYLAYELEVCTSVIGQLESEAEDRTIDCPVGDDDILNCCLQLTNQNYHVILLTNDENLCMKAGICGIQNFTVQAMKGYLAGNEVRTFLPTPLTITIQNRDINNSDVVIKKPNFFYDSLECNKYNSTPSFASYTNFKKQQENSLEMRNTEGILQNSSEHTKEIQPTNTLLNVKSDNHIYKGNDMEKYSIVLNNTANCNTGKRRQIRLKQSNTNNINFDNNIQFNNDTKTKKKPFKWHRRKSTNIDKLETISKHDDKANTKLCIKNKPVTINHSENSRETNIERLNDNSTYKKICTQEALNSRLSELDDTNSDNLIIDDTSKHSSNTKENMTNNTSMHIDNNFTNRVSAHCSDGDDWTEEEFNARNNFTKWKDNEHSNNKPGNEIFPFNIRDKIMEEKLKMGCEEWLSRYMQIMEEVLAQVLRLNYVTSNIELLPPPWTLHEATECIQRKYKFNFEISSNANNLSMILSKISNRSGKIAPNLGPAQYMKLFSSGCNLVEALKEIAPDSDDIKAAKASLVKLLQDIRDPNNIGFDVDVTGSAIDGIITQERNTVTKYPENCITNTNFQYSNSNNTEQNQQISVKNQTFQQDVQTCSRLLNCIDEDVNKTMNNIYDLPVASKSSENNVDYKNQVKFTNLKRTIVIPNNIIVEKEPHQNVPNKTINSVDTSAVQPKIIRNFTGIADFENKLLKKKHSFNLDELVYTDFAGMEDDDYHFEEEEEEEYAEEDGENEYDQEDENQPFNNMEELKIESHSNDTRSTNNERKTKEMLNFKIPLHVNQEPDKYLNIECFIRNFLDEFKATFLQVYTYCEETQKELDHFDTMSSSRKQEIYIQTESTYTHMNNMTRHLKGIIRREHDSNVDSLLKNAGLDNFALNDEQFSTYSDIIMKCTDQTTILLEVLTDIISMCKRKS